MLDVQVGEGFPANTTLELADAALRIRPSLARHACINNAGPTFGAVIGSTSLPHLFEHLILDEQVEMAKAASLPGSCCIPIFKGSTQWTDCATRRARVQISFQDDLSALEAVTRAQALMRRIFSEHFSMLE